MQLSDYFFENLLDINKARKFKLSDDCIIYMSHLLERGANRDFIFNENEKRYLFDLYKNAVESNTPKARLASYKFLGDYSLFFSGYFSENLNDATGIEYYIEMGKSAYSNAAIISDNAIYKELSINYISCVSLINELSLNRVSDPRDIIKLYNFWLMTRSQFTREKLLKLGLVTEEIIG